MPQALSRPGQAARRGQRLWPGGAACAAQVHPDARPQRHGHRPVGAVPVLLPVRASAAPSTPDATSYVDFLVPSYVATIVLFTGGGIAVAVAEDKVQGFTDRLLSLPVPRYSLVLGRTLADSTTNVWSILTTAAFGFLFGFRLPGTWQEAAGRLRPVRRRTRSSSRWSSS